MLKLDWHFYKEDSAEKMIFSLDWFTFEDHWTQLYMFERPMMEPESLERARIRNNNRCKWFRISANVMHLKIYLDFKLKKVGNVYHGRVMNDEPRPWPKRLAKMKKDDQ